MPLFETTLWIVHRDPGPRSALARMAGGVRGRHAIILGAPSDGIFESASPPQLVVLDVSSAALDPEPELDFANRMAERFRSCAWILVAEPVSRPAAVQLFDTLEADVLTYPPDARALQGAVARALEGLRPLPLSRRIGRDHLSARFARWFGHAEPPGLALALEPRLAAEPVLARGERGTGRGLLLRYVHAVSTPEVGPFVRVSCSEGTTSGQLVAQIEAGVREASVHARRPGGRFGLWLEDIDRLGPDVQARVVDWIEFGLPLALPPVVRGRVRWLASAATDSAALDSRLGLAFAELDLETRPLRALPEIVPAFVADTSRAWASARGESPKRFDEPALALLRSEPWPGNLAELEALVVRSLAHATADADTLRVGDLRFEPPARDGAAPGAAAPTPEPGPVPGPGPGPGPGETGDAVARLAAAVAHEVRNPLVSIRTFSELLDDHYEDEEFRERFGRLVAQDVRRIEDAVDRLEQMAEGSGAPEPPRDRTLDVTALLESLIDAQRPTIQSKRLLVLKELDRARPLAFGDEAVLRPALDGVLARAIAEVPDRGDLYLASRHQAEAGGRATMRIQFRHRVRPDSGTERGGPARPGFRETVLEHLRAESVVQSQGGTLTVDTTAAAETVIVIDLPAPSAT